jgi:hypothetical protein
MDMPKTLCGAALVLLVSGGLAHAQQIYKTEPLRQALNPGEKILVDNGQCPKGQILEITGGNAPGIAQRNSTFAAGADVYAGGQDRQRRCIPRPR